MFRKHFFRAPSPLGTLLLNTFMGQMSVLRRLNWFVFVSFGAVLFIIVVSSLNLGWNAKVYNYITCNALDIPPFEVLMIAILPKRTLK